MEHQNRCLQEQHQPLRVVIFLRHARRLLPSRLPCSLIVVVGLPVGCRRSIPFGRRRNCSRRRTIRCLRSSIPACLLILLSSTVGVGLSISRLSVGLLTVAATATTLGAALGTLAFAFAALAALATLSPEDSGKTHNAIF